MTLFNCQFGRIAYAFRYFVILLLIGYVNAETSVENLEFGIVIESLDDAFAVGLTFSLN